MDHHLETKRDELIGILSEAYADGRVSPEAYERIVKTVHQAGSLSDLMKVTHIVTHKLRQLVPREERAEAPIATNTIDRAVRAFYDAISWRDGTAPSLGALQAVVDRRARFVQGDDNMDVSSFWHLRVGGWVQRVVLPFSQREQSSRTSQFGRIAHRLSLYEAQTVGGNSLGRGVNSFQLVEDGGLWRIVSVLWEEESDDLVLPDDLD